jgi:hypothetical protein
VEAMKMLVQKKKAKNMKKQKMGDKFYSAYLYAKSRVKVYDTDNSPTYT